MVSTSGRNCGRNPCWLSEPDCESGTTPVQIWSVTLGIFIDMKKINDYLADKLSLLLSMMSTFYIVSLLVFVPLLYTQPTSLVAWASYICSVVFQGIALPVLGYTARKASDKTDSINNKMLSILEEVEKLSNLIESQQKYLIKEVNEIMLIEQKESLK